LGNIENGINHLTEGVGCEDWEWHIP
jgi:hypothetical protein